MQKKAYEDLVAEVQELRAQLEEAQETLDAIRRGEVDGLVVSTPEGEQVYTISGAERPYRALIEDMREGAVMLSDDNTVLYCNSGFAKMMRLPCEKIVGDKIESMVCPTYIPALTELLTLSRAYKGAVAKEVTLQAREDVLVPTLMSVNSLQSDTLKNTFLVVTDLSEHMEEEVKRYTTELELAQIALSESEQRWATTLASIGDAVIATDKLGNIKFMNRVAEGLTGWTLNEASKRPVQEIFKIVNEFSRKTVDDPVSKVLEKGMIVGLANHTILIRKDKTEVPIDDSGAPIKDKTGKITGVVLIFRDITGRKKAEEALSRLNEELEERVQKRTQEVSSERQRLYNVLETLPSYVILLDRDYHVAFANKVFRETFGEDHGRRCHEYLFGKDHECENCETYKVYRENKPQHWYWTGPNGHNYDIYDFPFKEVDGSTMILEMGIDITEQRKAEKKAKDSERLAAIGATAGMVGHDIRNPLQSITSDVFLAKAELESLPDSEQKKMALESIYAIEKNTEYINKIVQDLQDYARPLNPQVEANDLQQIIELLFAKNGLPKNITLKIKIDEKARQIRADSYYLNRILSNLVSNSVQAMPQGGQLIIEVRKEGTDSILSVHDTGVGIPENIQDKMFTPMFTTKSKGQGFGLPVVKRMTESLGGTVSFESQEGKGTTFTIRLPNKSK